MKNVPYFPDLEGKKILVTGAMRGIGRGIALMLAKQKAEVIFNYRGETPEEKQKEALDFAEELSNISGVQAKALYFDLTDAEQVKKSIDDYCKTEGPISGLVNNAGISADQLILRLKKESIDSLINTNLNSTIYLTSVLSRYFLKAKDVSVVNIGSVVGLMGNHSQVAYAASKAGLIGFTKSLAKELASRQVRCNIICPGFIATEMTDALSQEVKEAYQKQIPLGNIGTTADVASLACFLLSQSSSYITGEIIKIDGGLYI